MEYTLLVSIAFIFSIILDQWILKTKLLQNKKFYIFLVFWVVLQTVVDNWLNGRWWNESFIVGPYGEDFYSRILIWYNPLENYFYGFSLILMNISLFEFLTKKIYTKE